MTLEQHDKEANKAVERSIEKRFPVEEKQLLPRDDAAVLIGGKSSQVI